MSPTISVIMTTFNDKKYVSEAIESILKQTFSDFELLLADDGSSDKTQGLLRDYSKSDSRIKLSLQDGNKGQAYRLNQLIRKAQGEYIARMDSDDISLPDRFKIQLKYFKNNPKLELLGTQMFLWDEQTRKKKPLPLDSYSIRFYALLNNPFSHPTVMWKKGVITKYPDIDVTQDYALWSDIVYDKQTANTKQVLLLNRQHIDSKSSLNKNQQRQIALDIAKKNLKKIIPDWPDKKIDTLHRFIKHHPNDINSIINGWKLYKKLIKEFYIKYPGAKKSLSFNIFLLKTTINFLWIKFSIISWSNKFKLLFNLL